MFRVDVCVRPRCRANVISRVSFRIRVRIKLGLGF
jgi:hypothetical protein